jgi:hypothetical protein
LTLLAPYVLDAKRPVLLLPAHLIEKTKIEMRELEKHWILPRNLRMISYQMLGREGHARLLETYNPDLIVADEVQSTKNRKAAVTRRVSRYMQEHPETLFVALTGTPMKDSIRDFSHIIDWCLKEGSPVPRKMGEVEEWADALDEKVDPFRRLAPGALLRFATREDLEESDGDENRAARRGFRRRLTETPGVVATQNEQVGCKLHVSAIEYSVDDVTQANYQKLRTEWKTPDDWELMMAAEVWRVSREFALGFHYVQVDKAKYGAWDKKTESLDSFLSRARPPEEWRNARRDWAAYVREVLSHSRSLDTEFQVRKAVLAGERTDGAGILATWREQEPKCELYSFAVWHDTSALEVCEKWMKQGAGIVWTEHSFFAHELARRTGAEYYGQQGVNQRGEPIEKADPKNGAIIASRPANGTGRNLQAWNRGLITTCPTCPAIFEQLLGRTHRDGQMKGDVYYDILVGCKEHFSAWQSALIGAQNAEDTTGLNQKLLMCEVSGFPEEDDVDSRKEPRWGAVAQEKTTASVLSDFMKDVGVK